jgi:GR25 family glycosyltransferase involved in LPS biosynthesis
MSLDASLDDFLHQPPTRAGPEDAASLFDAVWVIARREKEADRLINFNRTAVAQNLSFSVFDATDGDALDQDELEKLQREGMISSANVSETLGLGSLACALSHIRVWAALASLKNATTDGTRPRWLVFEDDTDIPPNFDSELRDRLLPTAPSDWDYLSLNYNALWGSRVSPNWFQAAGNAPEHFNARANAYILNHRGAVRMLNAVLPFPTTGEVRLKDQLLRERVWNLSVAAYFVLPEPLATQHEFPSVRKTGDTDLPLPRLADGKS